MNKHADIRSIGRPIERQTDKLTGRHTGIIFIVREEIEITVILKRNQFTAPLSLATELLRSTQHALHASQREM